MDPQLGMGWIRPQQQQPQPQQPQPRQPQKPQTPEQRNPKPQNRETPNPRTEKWVGGVCGVSGPRRGGGITRYNIRGLCITGLCEYNSAAHTHTHTQARPSPIGLQSPHCQEKHLRETQTLKSKKTHDKTFKFLKKTLRSLRKPIEKHRVPGRGQGVSSASGSTVSPRVDRVGRVVVSSSGSSR